MKLVAERKLNSKSTVINNIELFTTVITKFLSVAILLLSSFSYSAAQKSSGLNLQKKSNLNVKLNTFNTMNSETSKIKEWLNVDENYDTNSLTFSSYYRNSIDVLFFNFFSQYGDGWTVSKEFHYGPQHIEKIQTQQAPFKEEFLSVKSIYLIKKMIQNEEKRLAIQYSFNFIYVHFNSKNPGDEKIATEFRDHIKKIHKQNHIYNGKVLEFKHQKYNSPSITFYPNVDNHKFKWSDLILEEKVKKDLESTIDQFLNSYNYEEWKKHKLPMNRGILLYGPPGTGKSFVSKVIVSNILQNRYKNKVSYIHIQARHIVDEDSIRAIYNFARDLSPCVLFFEDIDLIAGTGRQDRPRIKNELMQQLSGLESLNGVMTIGSTNYFERIDPALTRSKRLGYHFYIGLPSLEERLSLVQVLTKNINVENNSILNSIASKTEGFSGADLKELIELATERAVLDPNYKKGEKIILTQDHITSALEFKKKFQKL